MCQLFCCSIIQVVSFNYHQRNVRSRVSVSVSNFQVSVSSRNLSQVSVSEVAVSTTSLLATAQLWVSHVQMQCTIALLSNAQTEGKASVTPKSWLSRNDRKIYYHSFAASAELAYGQPYQDAPKNMRDQPFDGEFICRPTFWNIDWKMFFLRSLSIQCKIRCDRPSDTRRSTGWCNQPIGHPCSISVFRLHFFWLEFWTFCLKFYAVNLC